MSEVSKSAKELYEAYCRTNANINAHKVELIQEMFGLVERTETTMLVIATRDDDGYLTIWECDAVVKKFHGDWMADMSMHSEIAGDVCALNMLCGSFHGLRKGRKKVFNINIKEIK